MKYPCRLLLFIVCFGSISLHAQEKADPSPGGNLAAAVQLRVELAQGIEDTPESAQKAIARLRAARNPSGLPVMADADLAFAALEIGRRLLAAGKPAAAEEFFKVVAVSMQTAAAMTPDDKADEKVIYLRTLAAVSGEYLGQPEQAQAALDDALRLKPGDPRLKKLEQALASRRGGTHSPLLKQAVNLKGDS